MKYELPEATKQALRYLVQTATSEGITAAGFAFRLEPPAITVFGNCSDKADIKLYEFLCKLTEQKQADGMVVIDRVEEPV